MPSEPEYLFALRRAQFAAEAARLVLLDVVARQEQFFLEHRQYADSLAELGLPAAPCALNAQGDLLPAPAAGAIYLLQLESDGEHYTATASPLARQLHDRECGALGVDGRGRRMASGSGEADRCW